ncbi:MAG: tRNA pseudouridine(38-40) synthase TruA [Flavobacteriaceae bacterium]
MRYFIHFSYFGKHYHGWQVQPNATSVQGELTKALSLLLKSEIEIIGAGRTDSGVHAKEMYAHFDFNNEINSKELIKKLNSFLPKDIAVFDIFRVNDDAHARFDASRRTYQYHIHLQKDVFREDFSWYFYKNLDVQRMNKASEVLLKYIDFQCFSKSNTDVFTYNCNIVEAFWKKEGNQLVFTVSADRFLRNMVRAIVGTLIGVGLHKVSIEQFEEIIKSKNRSKAGFSVPAHGLYLTKIEYPFLEQKNRNLEIEND